VRLALGAGDVGIKGAGDVPVGADEALGGELNGDELVGVGKDVGEQVVLGVARLGRLEMDREQLAGEERVEAGGGADVPIGIGGADAEEMDRYYVVGIGCDGDGLGVDGVEELRLPAVEARPVVAVAVLGAEVIGEAGEEKNGKQGDRGDAPMAAAAQGGRGGVLVPFGNGTLHRRYNTKRCSRSSLIFSTIGGRR
jgi:hypothetical protein